MTNEPPYFLILCVAAAMAVACAPAIYVFVAVLLAILPYLLIGAAIIMVLIALCAWANPPTRRGGWRNS